MGGKGGIHWKHSLAALVIGVACTGSVLGFFAVSAAQAQATGASSPASGFLVSTLKSLKGFCPRGGPIPIPCPPEGAADALESIDQLVLKPIVEGALLFTVLDFVSSALDRAAYEAAIALVSAGSGQTPLIFTDDPEHGYQRFGLDIVGSALDSLNDFTQNSIGLKLDICDPSALSPDLLLSLQLGIKQAYQPTRPKCDFLQIGRNWNSFVGSIGETLDPRTASTRVLQEFAKGLRPGQNELSMAVGISYSTREEYNFKQNIILLEQLSNDGYKDQVDFVTGQIKTPASVLKARFEKDTIDVPEDQRQSYLQAAISNPNFLIGYLTRSLSIFTNTLASETIKKVYEGYFSPAAPAGNPFNANLVSTGGREQAIQQFSSLIAARPVSKADYSALGEFVTCPTGGVAVRNVNHCVMDQGFFQAVSRGATDAPLTVAEAVEKGQLHADWPLVSADDSRNSSIYCKDEAYCYGNLVKLRKARVIPIGWELAADEVERGEVVTLGDAMRDFDDCNAAGKPDASHRFCHLVDPNWVLFYPETQCRAYVNGEALATANAGARAPYCADTPSCISTDSKGNCTGGFGYCVREKNTWAFRGDSCPVDFAGCLSLTNTQSGERDGFLVSTVDFDGCNADNAGCRWYRTNKYPDDKGTPDPADDGYSFLPTGDGYAVVSEDAEPLVRLDRAYFNRQVKQCQAQDAGCSELLRADGLSLNLLRNGSFEDGTGTPDGWDNVPAGNYRTSGDAVAGSDSLSVAGTSPAAKSSEIAQDSVSLSKDSFYTVSVFAKGGAARVDVVLRDASTGANLAVPSVRGGGAGACAVAPAGNAATLTLTGPADFVRGTCTFTVTADALARVALTGSGSTVVDAVQLERGELATDFHDGYAPGNTAAFVANLKVPPAYLNCRGTAADPKECDAYAPVCAASDVGCELYDPLDGDPSVPAVASDLDRCPTECVGYAAFKQEATRYEAALYDPARTSFIPETARSCQAAHVGCDAFTNLDAVAAGGEGVEHYSDLRACATPAQADALSANATYFTWTASQGEGFQLRTWQLLKSDRSDAPCTRTSMPSENEIRCADPSPMPADLACDDHADTLTDLDCGEFYDALGVIHYRRFSKVAFVDAACHPYRKTDGAADLATAEPNDCVSGGRLLPSGECRYFGLPSASASCPASAAGCRAYTGGAGNNLATVFDQTFEEGPSSLSAFEAVGSLSPALAISADAVSAGGHSLRASDADQGEGIATVSGAQSPLKGRAVAGKTFFVEFFARGSGDVAVSLRTAGGTDLPASGVVVDLTAGWQPFTVGPIDTSAVPGFGDDATLRVLATGAGTEFYVDNLRLKMVEDTVALVKGSWSTPSTCDLAPNGAAAPQYYLGCEAYKDREGAQHEFYRFGRLCSEEVVGCQAFFDTRASASPYPQTFNARCTINTAATSVTPCLVAGRAACQVSPGKDFCLFSQPGSVPSSAANVDLGPEARVVGNDVPVYLVDDGSAQCSGGSVGCTEMGLPKFSQDKSQVSSFASSYLIDDPDDYAKVLCGAENLFCQEFKSTKDGNFYFKDPVDQTCEFKENVEVAQSGGGTRKMSGWFRSGTTQGCDPSFVAGGTRFGVRLNGDADYAGFVAECAQQYDRCTSFADPSDTQAGAFPEGVRYTVINDDKLSEKTVSGSQRCDGKVSQKAGCALFRDVTDPALTFASGPSYLASVHADTLYGGSPFDLRDPVSCPSPSAINTTSPVALPDPQALCSRRCRYEVGAARTLSTGNGIRSPNNASLQYAGSCLTDADCPAIEDDRGNPVSGACTDLRSFDAGSAPGIQRDLVAAAFRNDVNEVIKVARGRECAEWLECDSSHASWDPQTATFRDICDGIALCSDRGGDNSCSNFSDPQPVTLTPEAYATRDVSWNGLEYSGYAVPRQLPMDLLSQVNVNPSKWCANDDGVPVQVSPDGPFLPLADRGHERACSSASDCFINTVQFTCADTNEVDYRLAYVAGSCDEDAAGRGGECRVGFCSVTGTGCVADTDCDPTEPGDECAFGYCQTTNGQSCGSNSDCGGGIGGFGSDYPKCDLGLLKCVDRLVPNGDFCMAASDCRGPRGIVPTGATQCVPSAMSKVGACFNGSCLTDPSGTVALDAARAEPSSCRGYPEPTSPYDPGKVVVDGGWDPQLGTDDESKAPRPRSFVPGFTSSNTCAPVLGADGDWTTTDDCLCSYKKVTYAQGSATRYFGKDANVSDDGICVGGDKDGQECSNDAVCGSDTIPGTCAKVTREDTLLGWEGFCLERDTSIQLFGSADPDDRACLTWLPVDQLAGATDLFGKFEEAGFPLENSYYCSEAAYFVDLYPTGTVNEPEPTELPIEVACAMPANGDLSCDKGQRKGCEGNVWCPIGYEAIVGTCDADAPDGSADGGSICKGRDISPSNPKYDGTAFQWNVAFAPDSCPFICVPKDSYHIEGEDIGMSCNNGRIDARGLPQDYDVASDGTVTPTKYTDVRSSSGKFDGDYLKGWSDCVRRGVPLADDTGVETHYAEIGVTQFSKGGYQYRANADDSMHGSFGVMHRLAGDAVKRCGYTGQACNADSDCELDMGVVFANCGELCAVATIGAVAASAVISGGSLLVLTIPGAGPAWAACTGFCAGGALTSDNSCKGVSSIRSYSMRPYVACEEVLQVASDTVGRDGSFNKAWTNRLYEDYAEPHVLEGSEAQDLAYDAATEPVKAGRSLFGEYFEQDGTTDKWKTTSWDTDSWPLPLLTCNVSAGDMGVAGLTVAKQCADINEYPGEEMYQVTPTSSILRTDDLPYSLGRSYETLTIDDEKEAYAQVHRDSPNGLAEFGSSDFSNADSFNKSLSQFFTSFYRRFRFEWNEDSGGAYVASDATDNNDKSAVGDALGEEANRFTDPHAPIIRAVVGCEGAQCEEGLDGTFSVNDLPGGDILGGGGRQHVAASFYVEANPNQMPLRNVVVDWGDGDPGFAGGNADWPTDSQSGSTADDNFYKNHRGYEDEQSLCNGSDWGTTTQACDSTYVSFTHDYRCSNTILANLGGRSCRVVGGKLLNAPCTGGQVPDAESKCVFQPRVHVKDNWGWCTGECTGGVLEGDGCYGDECDTIYPSSTVRDNDPWVYYDGFVIVEP